MIIKNIWEFQIQCDWLHYLSLASFPTSLLLMETWPEVGGETDK